MKSDDERDGSSFQENEGASAWTVEVRCSRIKLITEIVLYGSIMLVASSFAALAASSGLREILAFGQFAIGGAAAAYCGYEAIMSSIWLVSGRLILAANEDVLQVWSLARKSEPPRVVFWSNVARIGWETVTRNDYDWAWDWDPPRHRYRLREIHHLRFELKGADRGRPLKVELGALDRPVNIVVGDLKERTGARAVSRVDQRLTEDHALARRQELGVWIVMGAIISAFLYLVRSA